MSTLSIVIVVDNASTEGPPSFIAERHPNVRLVAISVNLGFSAASNQGLKLASGRYRVLLNPDTVLLDRTLDRHPPMFTNPTGRKAAAGLRGSKQCG
jgi:GT2 family glycosyltransferase